MTRTRILRTTVGVAVAVLGAQGCGDQALRPPLNSGGATAVSGTTSTADRSGERSTEPPRDSATRAIPEAPITGRMNNIAFWTGTEMLVWGGREAEDLTAPANSPAADGAAYNPATNSWRKLAASPLAARISPAAVWTGREMLIWGGGNYRDQKAETVDDGAAYDPAADTWTLLPKAPIPAKIGATAVWSGAEMLVFGGAPGSSPEHQQADGAAYDPASRTWKTMPDAPFTSFYEHTSVWTGTELIVVAATFDAAAKPSKGAPEDPNFLAVKGAAYDPAAGTWRELPPANIARGNFHQAAWDGQRVLLISRYNTMIDGGQVNPYPTPLAPGGAYRPETNAWEQLRLAPITKGGGPMLWTGKSAVFWSGDPLGGVVYRADTDRWEELPAYDGKHREFPSVVWTGNEVLVWGGHNIMRFPDGSHGDGPLRPLADGVALSWAG